MTSCRLPVAAEGERTNLRMTDTVSLVFKCENEFSEAWCSCLSSLRVCFINLLWTVKQLSYSLYLNSATHFPLTSNLFLSSEMLRNPHPLPVFYSPGLCPLSTSLLAWEHPPAPGWIPPCPLSKHILFSCHSCLLSQGFYCS